MRTHRATVALAVGVALGAAVVGCPRGRPLASGVHVGRVAGVVPYSMSDQWGEQPESAFMCMSDPDCETLAVRDCCDGCSTSWLAVNHAAARAIQRYREANLCPAELRCPEVECDPDRPPATPPAARCLSQRCTLVTE